MRIVGVLELKEIVLEAKVDIRFPVDGSSISPDVFSGKSLGEIEALSLLVGNRERGLGAIFTVLGETADTPSDQAIRIKGDVRSFREIGKRMAGGLIHLEGDAGSNIGEEMRSGRIIIDGDAESWLGSSMKDGLIEVHGKAGNQIGASYRGRGRGMSGGTIVIHGNAGYEVGSWMHGGFIHVMGDVGQFAGVHMGGGEILIEGNSEGRLGANMTDGRIVLLGRLPNILPSFTFEEIRDSARAGDKRFKGEFYFFRGDLNEEGSGRLYVSAEANPHLKFYERFLE
ncbi:MAG: formylmethanofuran dehydrogenase subunit C [Candidatus Bathyarchaeia archaeon]